MSCGQKLVNSVAEAHLPATIRSPGDSLPRMISSRITTATESLTIRRFLGSESIDANTDGGGAFKRSDSEAIDSHDISFVMGHKRTRRRDVRPAYVGAPL